MASVTRWLGIGLAALFGVAVVISIRRTLSLRRQAWSERVSPDPWTPVDPRPPAPATDPPAPVPDAPTWVEPTDGVCPPDHVVKAKLASGIFHLPKMLAYERTRPDRCYRSEAAAAADGFTKAKR